MAKKAKVVAAQPYQPTATSEGYLLWEIGLIQPNPKQPRKYFDPEKMEALKKSIKRKGILTPLRIAPLDVEGHAKLVDGERRFRAARELSLTHVPVILSQTSKDRRRLFEESVISNFCREDMTEIEIARALRKLMDDNEYNQSEVAEVVGKTTGWVSNMLKYLKLHPEVADDLIERKINPAMALAVSRFPQEKQPEISTHLKRVKEQKGSALKHDEIALAVARVTAGKAIPVKPKKGKAPEMNPNAILIKALSGNLSVMRPKVAEVAGISVKQLEAIGGGILIPLEQDLMAVISDGQKLLDSLHKAI